MTKIKLCGLTGIEEITAVNNLRPDYIGFVFWEKSSRYVSPERAEALRSSLAPGITPVGVFVEETPEKVADLMNRGIIDAAQLHGREDAEYIRRLRRLLKGSVGLQKESGGMQNRAAGLQECAGGLQKCSAGSPKEKQSGGLQRCFCGEGTSEGAGLVIQAFRIRSGQDVLRAEESTADHILLDAGAGSGQTFDWELLRGLKRPFFLAGGLDADNVAEAVEQLHPFAVDVSSGIETDGRKDIRKMKRFVDTVRRVR